MNMLLGFCLLPLIIPINALKIPSFAPAKLPLSTKENDGTRAGRYDVRQTMAMVQDPYQPGVNSWFYLAWLTTVGGEKYHVTANVVIIGAGDQGHQIVGMLGFEDLSDYSITGKVVAEPGSGNTEFLNIVTQSANLTSPQGSDNYTDVFYSVKYPDVAANMHFQPTGPNIYMGGSGYVTLNPTGPSDYYVVPPGYSWYWGNPNIRIAGNITVKGKEMAIDPTQSFGFLERQWGQMELRNWYSYWLYLSNGIFVHAWLNEPTVDGTNSGELAVVTIWYPNGAHEVLPSDTTSKAWDASRSSKTGELYFNEFQLDLSIRNASLRVTKFARDAIFDPVAGVATNLSEAYAQGQGMWEGKPVLVFGHVEQKSALV